MLSVTWYLLKVIICSGILLGFYWLLLRNKIFHQYNRFYLLSAVVLSLGLPLIHIDILSNSDNSKSQVIQLLQAVNSGDSFVDNITVSSSYHQSFDYNTAAALIYIFVSLTFLIAFIQTLLLIRRLIKTHKANLVND